MVHHHAEAQLPLSPTTPYFQWNLCPTEKRPGSWTSDQLDRVSVSKLYVQSSQSNGLKKTNLMLPICPSDTWEHVAASCIIWALWVLWLTYCLPTEHLAFHLCKIFTVLFISATDLIKFSPSPLQISSALCGISFSVRLSLSHTYPYSQESTKWVLYTWLTLVVRPSPRPPTPLPSTHTQPHPDLGPTALHSTGQQMLSQWIHFDLSCSYSQLGWGWGNEGFGWPWKFYFVLTVHNLLLCVLFI